MGVDGAIRLFSWPGTRLSKSLAYDAPRLRLGQEQPTDEDTALAEGAWTSGRLLLPAETVENRRDDAGLLDDSDALHAAIASGTDHDIHRKHLQQELRPGHPAPPDGFSIAGFAVGHTVAARIRIISRRRLWDDKPAEPCIGCKDSEVMNQMHPRGRYQGREPRHQFLTGEEDHAGTVGPGGFQLEGVLAIHGFVQALGWRYLVIRSRDEQVHFVPNSIVATQILSNLSLGNGFSRVEVPFVMSAGSDVPEILPLILSAIEKATLGNTWVNHERPIKIVVGELEDDRLRCVVQVYYAPSQSVDALRTTVLQAVHSVLSAQQAFSMATLGASSLQPRLAKA